MDQVDCKIKLNFKYSLIFEKYLYDTLNGSCKYKIGKTLSFLNFV